MLTDEQVTLQKCLDNRLHVRIADFMYRTFFQPVVNLLDSLEGYWTRRWCENQIPVKEGGKRPY